jgi:ribosome-binding factor A
MVTVTSVEVSADLSHAKVFFTHLAGAEHAAGAIEALAAFRGLSADQASASLQTLQRAAAALRHDDSIESGLRLSRLSMTRLAEDRKPPPDARESWCATSRRVGKRSLRRRRRWCAAARQAYGIELERRAPARQTAPIARKSRPYRNARSAGERTPPICFGEATKFAQALLDADKRPPRRSASARAPRPATPTARSSRRARSPPRAPTSKPCCRGFSAAWRRCLRATPR